MTDEEKLHNDLNNRINEVFDNYEDTTANEGWALLRQKFPEKEKDRGLAWLWYAAAAVVLLGVGLWFIGKPTADKNLVVKTPKVIVQPHQKNNGPVAIDSLVNENNNAIAHSGKQPAHNNQQNTISQSSKLLVTTVPVTVSQKQQIAKTQTSKGVISNPATLPQVPAVSNQMANNQTTIADPMINKTAVADVLANNPAAGKTSPVKTTDSITANQADKYVAVKLVDAQKPTSAEAMNKLLNESTPALNNKQKTPTKNATLSVYAATYFNYAEGSENNINVGAGFSSDFKLSNKLKLSTGIAIAQNSLKYNNGQPVQGGGSKQSYASAAAAPARDALNQVAAGSSGTANNGFSSGLAVVPTLKNYNASLIGLDIPINLKYQFNPQKNDTYISAGLSSGTFINETYVLNYDVAQQEQQNTTRNSFNDFYFAKTLNLSFGVGYPLGKTNRLIVEPFLKYPLDGLGSQQIRFGAGGINLKLNFTPAKK